MFTHLTSALASSSARSVAATVASMRLDRCPASAAARASNTRRSRSIRRWQRVSPRPSACSQRRCYEKAGASGAVSACAAAE